MGLPTMRTMRDWGQLPALLLFVLIWVTVVESKKLIGATLHGPYRADLKFLQKLNANAVRVRIPWKLVQKDDIKDANEIDRIVVMRSRNYYGAMEWWERESKTHNYPQADEVIFSVVDTGFDVVAVIGEGTVWSMPTVDGVTVCPNDLGTQTYLSLLYRYARMVVMR